MEFRIYRIAFALALVLHVVVIASLVATPSNKRPVMVAGKDVSMQMAPKTSVEKTPEVPPIQAVSVNNQEVMEAVNQLRQKRMAEKQAEVNRQKQLEQQALAMKQQRIAEQKRIKQLKVEAEKAALIRKKQLVAEQQHLKQLAQQKAQEENRIAELKSKQQALKKQQEEAAKLVALKQKMALEEAKKAAEAERKRLAAKEAAAANALREARMAGEVDKYKAMIVNAISQQWILPDNVDNRLSSQFRIRLAPTGEVLEVSLLRSSGDPILDRSAQAAIYKASPLPVPHDQETFNLFRDISLTVRPETVRG